ncbi:hypothetical protein BDV95DRAFT_303514 [Massariosphaeria phaeospora]|uniref:Uncharacterized protein n=1 Tax=Massariosphaeria phaeospora TaxID=100035 RepID=A0A7C8MCN1_9PLEO|nr:hypothetical protein BDV95DRAFT_303514 [Massariosphaeria phaeospora]
MAPRKPITVSETSRQTRSSTARFAAARFAATSETTRQTRSATARAVEVAKTSGKARPVADRKARVSKERAAIPARKQKDGLLNTVLETGANLLRIVKRNSAESPLLRLPSELRNQIWDYAVCGNQVLIHDPPHATLPGVGGSYEIVGDSTTMPPNFKLPQVCRQTYVETGPLIYSNNTFRFQSGKALDHWIKRRALGQRRRVQSLDIPTVYMSFYQKRRRREFNKTFPDIKRIGVDTESINRARWHGKESVPDSFRRMRLFMLSWEEKSGEELAVEHVGSR